MLKTPIARGVALATLGATLAIPSMAQAAFIEDTKAGLELRNFYYNADNRSNASTAQSKQDEWAQGFILRIESGFTEGPVGFGVDALGLLGVKLDSSEDRAGTGILPGSFGDEAPDDYSSLHATAKMKVSKTILKVGALEPKNMAIARSDTRILPQTFQGAQLISKEVDGLTLDVGYLTKVKNRNSSNYEDISYQGKGAAVGEPDDFIFAGATYSLMKNLTGAYYYSNLEEVYKQHSFNLVHVQPLGENQSLKTDLRYARSTDDGSSNVDNKALGAMVTYSVSGHSFGLGYQKMSGDTGFAYAGAFTDQFLVNYVMIGVDYANADEKSWQARYDYNFAAMGIPGLTFMTRYVSGDNFGAGGNAKEWERNTDIGYVFQEGTLKNLGVKWRNGTYRSSNNNDRDIDQNRLIVSYTIPLM